MSGSHFSMGPSALVKLQIPGDGFLWVLLRTNKTPPLDLGQWSSVGLNYRSLVVIGVKAAVAHRRAYDPIAAASFSVSTPGPCSSDLRSLSYNFIRRPIYPLDHFDMEPLVQL